MTTRSDLQIIETDFRIRSNPQVLIAQLIKRKKDFLLRQNSYMTTVIHNNKEIAFPNRKEDGFKISQLWVFRSVKNDAKAFLQRNPDFKLPTKLPTNKFNYECSVSKDDELTGTDINSAYWTIAYKLGVISERTYQLAGADEFKVVRLAALAVLGKDKPFQKYEKGIVKKNDYVILKEPVAGLQDLYKAIRYTCYLHMDAIAKMLGNDFECYKTDCIYYKDTPENRKLVHNYLSSEGFTFKQLVYQSTAISTVIKEESEKPEPKQKISKSKSNKKDGKSRPRNKK